MSDLPASECDKGSVELWRSGSLRSFRGAKVLGCFEHWRDSGGEGDRGGGGSARKAQKAHKSLATQPVAEPVTVVVPVRCPLAPAPNPFLPLTPDLHEAHGASGAVCAAKPNWR